MPQGLSVERAPPSQFVTVLGRIAMAFAIVGVLMAAVQALIVPKLMALAWDSGDVARSMAQMQPLLVGVYIAGLATSSFNVFMCRAFLKRQNWARIGFLVVLGLGAVLSALSAIGVGAFLGWVGAHSLSGMPDAVAMISYTYIALAILAAVNAAVSVWLMVRLASPPIRAEFGQR